jgi:hypothetical protein
MKILFEEYHYEYEMLKEILSDNFYIPVSGSNKKRKINYVGYYCSIGKNGELKEPIMIFPKVFLKYDNANKKPKAFGYFDPDEIIDILEKEKMNTIHSKSYTPSLLYEMSVWLYRAIDKYRSHFQNENISEAGLLNPVLFKKDNHSLTELEIVEALRLFYEQNKDLFTFITRKTNSHNHRIKWNKTINRKTPVLLDNRPVYFDVYSNKKKINYEEELIRIFYSVLNSLNYKYGFNFELNFNYNIIKGSEYKRFEKRGYRYLKSTRYLYYNDKMLRLNYLLTLYFERISNSRVGKGKEEYVLIKDFNRVFEEMIDNLIGDPAIGEIKKMKTQPDNKQLDHIYREKGVFQNNDIYFIADSKYYTESSAIDEYSSFKQFTYARNVLSLNLDIFRSIPGNEKLRYRDEKTDGYHPTPNFFISAYYDENKKITDHGLMQDGIDFVKRSSHWCNRLFDRDSLFTLSYRINFMFVLQSFVRKKKSYNNIFKKETRELFRNEFIHYLDITYAFYILKPKGDFQNAIDNHFKLLLGISFCPSFEKKELIMALEKNEKHRELNASEIISELERNWWIIEIKLSKYEKENN